MVVLTISLGISVGLAVIIFNQLKVIYETGNSVVAFYGADSGIERGLYEIYKHNAPSLDVEEAFYIDSNIVRYYVSSEEISPDSQNCPSNIFSFYCLKSRGEFLNTARFIHAGK